MRYAKTKVRLPDDMQIGSKVGIVGEGWGTYEVTEIVRDDDGDVLHVHNSSGWAEPLCKMYLLRGRGHQEAYDDPTSWIEVAIGECDECGEKFPDCCIYYSDTDGNMLCQECRKKIEES